MQVSLIINKFIINHNNLYFINKSFCDGISVVKIQLKRGSIAIEKLTGWNCDRNPVNIFQWSRIF
jgi:hypothetical protein